ncbi:MAG: FAD-dependent oxidoreductase [Actinomycetota bacterium]|nr:FAD-dependent oxidoreductase [Actinomycetota bacterium]
MSVDTAVNVDVLIVGGGIQGLVVLRELTEAGYAAALVTAGELGVGQTLHSHGLLNSGTGLLTGTLREQTEATVAYLRRLGVPVYGEASSFLALPPAMVEQLSPLWQANGHQPAPVDTEEVGFAMGHEFRCFRVPGYHVAKRSLVRRLAAGLADRTISGALTGTDGASRYEVTTQSGDRLDIECRAVVVAGGCGTKRLLRDVMVVDSPHVDRIGFVRIHMLCVRAPAGVLAPVATLVSPDVVVVGHLNDGHDTVGQGRDQASWYVSPASVVPEHLTEAPDTGAAEVDPQEVALAVERLIRLLPALTRASAEVEATVFAGYKQDVDGHPARPAVEVVDPRRAIVLAVPSVLANAVPNALAVLAAVKAVAEPSGSGWARPDELPAPSVGVVDELRSGVAWRDWPTFAAAYGHR